MRNTSISALRLAPFALAAVIAMAGCGEDGHDHGNENEVITTVILTFTPGAGGVAIVAKVDDPDGDGGGAPTVEPITVAPGMYDLAVKFENRLAKPPEDITEEVRDEAAEHQVFFTGTAVSGPASSTTGAPLVHAYADMDSKGLPLGLANKVTATAGMGTLTVTLRHMPPVNNMPVKTAAVAGTVRSGGFAAIGGSTDVQVNFPVTVR
jgi:hypothetical protein